MTIFRTSISYLFTFWNRYVTKHFSPHRPLRGVLFVMSYFEPTSIIQLQIFFMNRACISQYANLHEQNQHASSIRPLRINFVRMKKSLMNIRRLLLLTVWMGFLALSTLAAQETDTLRADDLLRMSFDDLMNTRVISASKVQQQVKDVASTVQVITAEQIRERGYFTLEEALADLPGFQFRNILGYNSYSFMRGAPGQNNLILLLIDGVQVNELNSGGFYGGGQYNLSDIERIEVVYGPASALYGTNAVSGIIHLITKKPEGKHQGHLRLLGGNFATAMADFGFENYDEEHDVGYRVSAMYKTSEKADLRGARGDYNWSDQMENFEDDISLSARVQVKNFSAGLLFMEKRASRTTAYKTEGSAMLDRNTLWDMAFLNGYLKYEKALSEQLGLNSMLYYRNSTLRPHSIGEIYLASDTSAGSRVGYYRPGHLAGMENQLTYRVNDKWFFVAGVVGEVERLSEQFSVTRSNSQEADPPEPGNPAMQHNYLFSYYLQSDWHITPGLSFVGGLRHDISSYYGRVVTPRTGLVWNWHGLTSKLLYNRAFRSPKPWDYSFGLGNPALRPEQMESFELAFSWRVMDQLSLGASAYRNRINDKLGKEIGPFGERWVNNQELNTRGFELYGNYSLNRLGFLLNYTFTDSYNESDASIAEISRHIVNAGVTWRCNRNLVVNLRSNYLGSRKNFLPILTTGDDQIGDALLFHGAITLSCLKGAEVQLKVNNLFDQRYYHSSNLFAGRFRQPQRTVSLMVGYRF